MESTELRLGCCDVGVDPFTRDRIYRIEPFEQGLARLRECAAEAGRCHPRCHELNEAVLVVRIGQGMSALGRQAQGIYWLNDINYGLQNPATRRERL